MENESSKTPSSSLSTFLQKRAIRDSDKTDPEKVILPDECGDTLWDNVLAQGEKAPIVIKEQQSGDTTPKDESKD